MLRRQRAFVWALFLSLVLAQSAWAEPFRLQSLGRNAQDQRRWSTPAGLQYTEKVLRKVVALGKENKPASKQFLGKARDALMLADEAWSMVRSTRGRDKRIEVQDEGNGVKIYRVDMGRDIGVLGSTDGQTVSARHVELMVARERYVMAVKPVRGVDISDERWQRLHFDAPAQKARTLEEATAQLTAAGSQPAHAARAAGHVRLGLPSAASYNSDSDRLRVRNGYVVSMNKNTRILNWASWVTTGENISNDAKRADDWRADPTLGADFPKVDGADYLGASGFHRGHMVRSRERTWKLRENSKTFVYSNAVPQAKNNNVGAWNGLEEFVRTEASAGATVYNYAGPVIAGRKKTIGRGVAVPPVLFKIATILAPGETKITADTRVVAVMLPNHNRLPLEADWSKYRVSVAQIEKATGLKFFTNLAPDVAEALRQKRDTVEIPYVMPPFVKEELARRNPVGH